MFHIKNNISAGLVLAAFVLNSAAFAADDGSAATTSTATTSTATTSTATTSTDTTNTPPKKTAKKKRTKAAAVSAPSDTTATPQSNPSTPTTTTTAPTGSTAPANSAPAVAIGSDDSPEAIKLRSGPGDPSLGKEKSELCQGCHGEEGISIEGLAPKLAGQYGIYIAKQLRNFQSGARVHQIMSGIAATVSDDDLADIAAYFASRNKMKGNGTDNKVGQELFLHGDMSRMMVACVNCHGANGKGKTPTNPVFPVIGGQHRDYIRGQLINFRAGDRSNSPGGVMNIITQRLTDTELEALADFVSGL